MVVAIDVRRGVPSAVGYDLECDRGICGSDGAVGIEVAFDTGAHHECTVDPMASLAVLKTLKAGETKTISFTVNAKLLQFYTANKKWEVEPGDFDIWIGGNSNAVLKSSFTVK